MSLLDVRHLGSGALVSAVASLAMVGPARAEAPIKLCIPETPGRAVIVPNAKGECVNTKTVKYNKVQLPWTGGARNAERGPGAHQLRGKRRCRQADDPVLWRQRAGRQRRRQDGIRERRGQPRDRLRRESLGREQTGSHNLILGEQQSFKSYGGIVAGHNNSITGPFASVTAGEHNTAGGLGASVSGGIFGTASAWATSVSGGLGNSATGLRRLGQRRSRKHRGRRRSELDWRRVQKLRTGNAPQAGFDLRRQRTKQRKSEYEAIPPDGVSRALPGSPRSRCARSR